MFRQRTKAVRARRTILLVAAAAFGACTSDDGVDYCKNHYAFHSDHLDTIATLMIEIPDTGDLEGSLTIPSAAFGDATESDIRRLLGSAENTFTLQNENSCEVSVRGVSASAGGFDANFAASCGIDNKLGKIEVSLFEHFSSLEEVVTSITTSATSKRFGISRQCDSPIFRLD